MNSPEKNTLSTGVKYAIFFISFVFILGAITVIFYLNNKGYFTRSPVVEKPETPLTDQERLEVVNSLKKNENLDGDMMNGVLKNMSGNGAGVTEEQMNSSLEDLK